jgi:hypothetical protein
VDEALILRTVYLKKSLEFAYRLPSSIKVVGMIVNYSEDKLVSEKIKPKEAAVYLSYHDS